MNIEKKINRLKRQMEDFEKEKIKTDGAIESELKTLASEVGGDCSPDEAEANAKKLLKKLKKKKKKAQEEMEEMYTEIEAEVLKLGLEI